MVTQEEKKNRREWNQNVIESGRRENSSSQRPDISALTDVNQVEQFVLLFPDNRRIPTIRL